MEKTINNSRKLNTFIRQTVFQTIREIFSDPDFGLPLTAQAAARLKKSIRSKKTGRVVEFDEILREYRK